MKRYNDTEFLLEGIMNEGNYLRPLSKKEYDFWQLHPLPFMWNILVEPYGALTPESPQTNEKGSVDRVCMRGVKVYYQKSVKSEREGK